MPAPPPEVTVYWRPMCGYCGRLTAALDAAGVGYKPVNIWEDRSQADIVRRASGGDEVVPTVRVGEQFLVNPRVDDVLAAVAAAQSGPG